MLRKGLILFLAAHAGAIAAMAREPQRRQRPATNFPTTYGALGILPDSVRSILLLYAGKNITRPKVRELEADLIKKPADMDVRLNLIGYYSANAKTAEERLRYRNHVLWVLENHPEHPATGESSLRDLPDDPEGNGRILAIWQSHLGSRPDDLALLKNAERFFFGKDPAEAERLIYRISEQEPDNPHWPAELAQLYRMFGIPGQYFDDPADRALEAYNRVLALTRQPAARESLAGEMAAAAFKIGDYEGAVALAKIHLHSSDRTAVQRANTVLGRVAIRSGDLAGGKRYLLDSSKPEASRDVSVTGPTMLLAKELLARGEREAVIQYLENCLDLWPRGETFLRNWIAEIKSGRIPNFGNLAN